MQQAAVGGKWVCFPYPAMPDRFRCTMDREGRFGSTGTDDDSTLCEYNPRMLPSCEDGVAGGIVEVFWQ